MCILKQYFEKDKIFINDKECNYNKKLIFINDKLHKMYTSESQFIKVNIKIYLDCINSENKYFLIHSDENFIIYKNYISLSFMYNTHTNIQIYNYKLQKLKFISYKTSLNSDIVHKRFLINDFYSLYNFKELLFYNTYLQKYLYYSNFTDKNLNLYIKNFGDSLHNTVEFDISNIINYGLNFLFEFEKHKIIHGDIKPNNIIINSKELNFIDYESFLINTGFNLEYKIFTPNFLAPEVKEGLIDHKNDLYSFGKSILCKLYKKYNIYNLQNLESLISHKYYNILQECINPDYNRRTTVSEIIQKYNIPVDTYIIDKYNFKNINIQIQLSEIKNICDILYQICKNLNKIYLYNYTVIVFYYYINFKLHILKENYTDYILAILFYSSLILDNYNLNISEVSLLLNLSESEKTQIYNLFLNFLFDIDYKIFDYNDLLNKYNCIQLQYTDCTNFEDFYNTILKI
jgi:serine/threonine protein kinase